MNTILIFNDDSAEAKHAAGFVLGLAQSLRANILLANTFIKDFKKVKKIPAGFIESVEEDEESTPGVFEYLKCVANGNLNFVPEIREFDVSTMNESQVAEIINKNNIWMMVKGIPEVAPPARPEKDLNVQTVLNKVLCPLLLVPANWKIKDLERLVYIADLRYCRIEIVKYLANLAKPLNADILIAHLTAQGLPDMCEKYAQSVFEEGICRNVSYENLYFNNIKEKNLKTAVDVIINGMRNDMLVLVNHRFHFEEIVGRYITNELPENLTIPLLIFPF